MSTGTIFLVVMTVYNAPHESHYQIQIGWYEQASEASALAAFIDGLQKSLDAQGPALLKIFQQWNEAHPEPTIGSAHAEIRLIQWHKVRDQYIAAVRQGAGLDHPMADTLWQVAQEDLLDGHTPRGWVTAKILECARGPIL